jgi:hypothetical protein
MQPRDLQSEISSLEIQVAHHEKKLDKAFADNAELRDTKKIYHELKLLKDRLTELTELRKSDSSSI